MRGPGANLCVSCKLPARQCGGAITAVVTIPESELELGPSTAIPTAKLRLATPRSPKSTNSAPKPNGSTFDTVEKVPH
ncbi:hypothetical protein FRB94_011902 [Tulasnella sp. JGI-2019a]|nr:hypothetical protein FRB94_011902 [Tulasnella sp. JGI-2019a]KAG9028549.1 hypothetical protein FRB95_006368 [Tulasnella sp. JGI-2019a]